jgi:hypothetical protein
MCQLYSLPIGLAPSLMRFVIALRSSFINDDIIFDEISQLALFLIGPCNKMIRMTLVDKHH